jgi:23S rRNA (guanine745-N1)-methyltransferase
MLLCTVRSCHLPLRREARRWVCGRGHAYDVARSGYTNLLQPNERRSRNPGDSPEAVAARRRLHERGLLSVILNEVKDLVPRRTSAVLDVGCGDGYWLAGLDAQERIGIDISVPAIDAAARRYPECSWFVVNADRFVPFSDGAFDLVMSITARMNSRELRRVLRGDGRLLVAVAAPDDLIELRAALEKDRAANAVETFANDFDLVERRRASATVHLDREGIRDVMTSSYRAMRTRERERLGQLGPRDVTFSRDLLLFAPGSRGTPGGSSG